jgi:glycine hydroxymethyltransferase
MAEVMKEENVRMITGGTDNHLILADVFGSLGVTGAEAEDVLDRAGITLNKNAIADDTRKPLDPSGIRFGTPAITTRGFGEEECRTVARAMVNVLRDRSEENVKRVMEEIRVLATSHPTPESFR